MFPDPTSITVSGSGVSLPRVEIQGKKSIYQSADGLTTLTISHQPASGDRVRTSVRLDVKAIVPDPLTAVNDYETFSYYSVIDRPSAGFSVTTINSYIQAHCGFLTLANVTKLVGGES